MSRNVGLYNKLDTIKLILDSATPLLAMYSSTTDKDVKDPDCIRSCNLAVYKSFEFLQGLLDTDFEGYDQEEDD